MAQRLASLFSDRAASCIPNKAVPQPKDVAAEPPKGGDPAPCSRALTEQPAGVGIIVFSSTCKTVYANQTAVEFLKGLNRWENGHATDGALPGSVADLFDEMQLALASQMREGVCERLAARRTLVAQDQTVLLQAFGLPDGLRIAGSRVVITVQGVVPPAEVTSSDVISASS